MEFFKIYSLDNLEFAQSHTLREDPDPLIPAGAAEIADAGEVEPPGVTTHKLQGASRVVGAAPALAKGTSSVKPAGEAARATAAKPGALVPWAQGVTKHEVERLLQEGKLVHEAPPQKSE